jgi:hypothetical protein
LHEAVADKLESSPEWLGVARSNLERWLGDNPRAALREWQTLIDDGSIDQIVRLLRSDDEVGRRMRQSSPFAGVLSASERLAILRDYDARRP